MDLHLQKSTLHPSSSIQITGSKSESNRLLLLQALFPELHIENLSNSDDSQLMTLALASNEALIDIHHAGTAMRFLTAFFATQEQRSITLTGSQRMKERPIQILVEALNQLGAQISYKEKEGFPPLSIIGKQLKKNKVQLRANISSQYISALLLIAPKLENGIELSLEGEITSVPYINMTLSLLNQIGVDTHFENNKIRVQPKKGALKTTRLTVESDWSSASYFFSIIALAPVGTTIRLGSYKPDSLQGDSVLVKIYKDFGVETTFEDQAIHLKKVETASTALNYDLSHAPDIAQTIAVTAFALGKAVELSGLHTLKIKETDRLVALKTELEKLGGSVVITENTLSLTASDKIKADIKISTYNDHRMAMAFAPLALKTSIIIEDAAVVSKSYPSFWEDLKQLGFQFE